jgi:hypothetical protein
MEKLANAFSMAPLTPQEAERITLEIDGAPNNVSKGEVFIVSANLNNSTDRRLASLMPNPFHISFHWLDEKGNIVVHEGLRSVLNPPLYGHQRASYPVKIKAPNTAGRYVLRVLPVQETVCWFESENSAANSIITVHE